eukprot:scaffold71694_cov31-Attheya_sp.AAC.1
MVKKYGLTVERVHAHIGSGSDPGIWQSLQFCKLWDTVTILNLGGGYKVGRNQHLRTSNKLELLSLMPFAPFQRRREDVSCTWKLNPAPTWWPWPERSDYVQ